MSVNGIKLAAGQKWKTKNYGVVTLSERGVNSNYPWRMDFPNNGDPIGSITTDGKYWEEDEMPELLECIYNPEDKKEEVKEEPRYTMQEIKEVWDASGWVSGWDNFQNNLTKIRSPEYQEYLRLKAIYE